MPTDQEPSRTGLAFGGDYLLVAETQAEADGWPRTSTPPTLADSEDFTAATARTGDPGIVTMYVVQGRARRPDDRDAQRRRRRRSTRAGSTGSTSPSRTSRAPPACVRFSDGAVEAEFSAKGLPRGVGGSAAQGGPDVAHAARARRPRCCRSRSRTAGSDSLTEGLRSSLGSDYDQMLAQGEQATGLQLPEDVETLLGDGFSLSVDAGTDLRTLAESPDPSTVPAGLRIQGDPATITPVIDKLKAAAGPGGDLVKVASGDGVVAVGLDPDYVDAAAREGRPRRRVRVRRRGARGGPRQRGGLRELRRRQRLGRAAGRPGLRRRPRGAGRTSPRSTRSGSAAGSTATTCSTACSG